MSDSSSAACDQQMSDSSSAACDQQMSDSSSAACDQQMSDSSSAACDQQMSDSSSAACDQQMSDSFSLSFYSPDSLESRSSLESGKEGRANEFVFPHEQSIFSDYTMPVGYNTLHQTKNDEDVKVNNNLPVRVETKCFHQSFFPLCSKNLDKTVSDICDRHIYHSNRQMLYRDTIKPLLNNTGGKICDISVYAPHKCSTFLIAKQPNFEENDFMVDNVENRLICNVENTHLTSVIQSINLKKSFLQEQINEVASKKLPKELATRKKGSKILLDQSEIKKYDVSAIQAKVWKSEMSVDQREIHESEMSAAQAEILLDQSKLDESSASFEHVGDNDRFLIMEDINSSIKLSQILKKTRNKKNNQNMKKTTSQSRLQHTGPFVCQPTSLPTWSLHVDDFYYKKRRQMKHMNFSKSSLIQSCKSLIQRPQSKSRVISSLPLPLTQKPINDSNDYISSRFHKLGMSCKFSSARSPPKWTCPNIEYSKRFIKSQKRTKSEQKSITSVTYMMNSSRPGCRLKTMCMRRNKVGLVSTRCFNVCQTHVPVLARSTPEVNLNTINNQHGQNKNFTQFKHKRSISKYVPHNLQTKQYLKATRQSTHSVNVYSKFKPPVDLCDESSTRVNFCDKLKPSVNGWDKFKPSVKLCDKSKSSANVCDKSKPSVKLYDKSKPSVNGWDKFKPSVKLCDKSKSSANVCDKSKPSVKLYDKSKPSVNGWDKFKPSVKLCDKSKSSANICDKSKPSIRLCDKSKPSVKFCDKSKPSFYVRDKSKHSDHKSKLQVSANTIQKDLFRTKRLSSNSSELPGDKDVFARLAVSHSKCIGDTSSLCCQLLKDVSESSCSWVFAQDDIKNVWALNKKFSDKTCTEKKNKKDVENVGIRCTSRNKNILDINSLKRVVACVKALINKQNTLLKAIDDTIELLQLKEHILDPFKAYDVHFNKSDKETLIS
ncbi:hypothetical protein Btru_070028 [Bulinus truncatus]|nr:hypothetical protein Btru_070028 [Bulinus truncatus]